MFEVEYRPDGGNHDEHSRHQSNRPECISGVIFETVVQIHALCVCTVYVCTHHDEEREVVVVVVVLIYKYIYIYTYTYT